MNTKTKATTGILTGLAAVALLLVAFPAVNAQTQAFGTVVAPGNGDTTYILAGAIFGGVGAFQFVDDDGNGIFNADEPVYFSANSGAGGTVAGLDIRVANTGSFAKGSQVRASHSDFGNPLTAFGASAVLSWYDANGDGLFTAGETLYLDIDPTLVGAPSGTVTAGDIILSGSNAGNVVGAGTAGLNNPLTALVGAVFSVFDSDGDAAYSTNDVIYIDTNADGFVTVQDIHLSGPSFGRVVTGNDVDVTYILAGAIFGGAGEFLFIDDDGNGIFNADEAVYFAANGGVGLAAAGTAAGTVAGLDIRIANTGSFAKGSQVRASHSDFGNPYTSLGHGAGTSAILSWYDANGDGLFTAGETLYLDIDPTLTGAPSGTVTAGDIILSGSNAGNVVGAGTAGLNNPLTPLPAAAVFTVFDADGDAAYSTNDVIYLDTNGDGFGTVQDVRMSGNTFGRVLAGGDYDTTYSFVDDALPGACTGLGFGFTTGAFEFVDDDGNGIFNADESVYFATNGGAGAAGTIAGLDIRVANTGSFAKGSQVRASHSDFGNPLTPFGVSAVLSWYDANGDGLFTAGETLYLDIDPTLVGAPSGTVTAGDIILSGSNAGNVVGAGTPGLNNPLTPLAAAVFDIFDADGDLVYSTNDVVYIDTNADCFATVQDVRLGGSVPPAPGTGPGPGDGTPTTPTTPVDPNATTPTTPTTPTTTPTTPTTPTTEPTPTTPRSPGFGIVALIGAVAAAAGLAVRLRKRRE